MPGTVVHARELILPRMSYLDLPGSRIRSPWKRQRMLGDVVFFLHVLYGILIIEIRYLFSIWVNICVKNHKRIPVT